MGAPVRGSAWIDGNYLFVGNAKGVFAAIHKKTGVIKWSFQAAGAIHSSAIGEKGRVYFADNRQSIYALDQLTGKLLWKFDLQPAINYPWRYDYYPSSPVIQGNKLLVGGDDGFFYALDIQTGKVVWKYKCKGIVRSTAAVYRDKVLFGDTEAGFYALSLANGKEIWQCRINGDTMNNEDWGFDRRAITSSAVVKGNKVIFGARDGYLYCVDVETGKRIWTQDHEISWIISTVAIKDSMVVTGTSDGRFVQAVHLETGKEIWKYRTTLAVWASPLIVGDKVYAGSFDGQLYCIDLKTGKRVSQFRAGNKFMASPLWNDGLLYAGSDDGYLYALEGHADRRIADQGERFVFYEPNINVYFRNGSDLAIKNYLRGNGYTVIGSDTLVQLLKRTSRPGVIVFASSYFPAAITSGGRSGLLRDYLDHGGRIVMTGINPIVYRLDEKTKQAVGFNPYVADTILNLDYGKGDTRTFMGDFPSFPTAKGRLLGLPDFWSSSLFIDEKKVDIVLGRCETGVVSAFAKNYSNGGQFIQIWMNADKPENLDAIIKTAEWKIE
ncbi:PQQ enzyme repeat protein [Ostertagia ostertagi]